MIRELISKLRPGLEPEPEPVPWAIEKYDLIDDEDLR